MKKDQKRMFDLKNLKGFKMFIIFVFASLALFVSPQAVCYVNAAEPIRFSTYLMIDENGEFATDADGKYIQLFDEKGNLLTGNRDVIDYLRSSKENGKNTKLGAREKAFYLIDGKFYFDEEGENLITDLSQVLPAIFKYGDLESGYTLESDFGTVIITSDPESEEPLYIARVSGTYEKLPAFTLDRDGNLLYFDKAHIGDELYDLFFVYDADNFYDQNLNKIESVEISLPDLESENEPLFTGYYITNGAKCLQFIDREGNFVISPAVYTDMITDGAVVEPKYCYGLKLTVDGNEILFLYADIDEGAVYEDFQESTVFEALSEEVLEQIPNDEESGFFAGFYAVNNDGEYLRFIDENGYLISDSLNFVDGNIELKARFYQIIPNYQDEEGFEVYLSDGELYIDPELLNRFVDIETSVGKTRDGDVIFFTYEDEHEESDQENKESEDSENIEEESSDDVEEPNTDQDETAKDEDESSGEEETALEDKASNDDSSSNEEDIAKEDAITKENEEEKESEAVSEEASEAGEVKGVKRVKKIKRIKIR